MGADYDKNVPCQPAIQHYPYLTSLDRIRRFHSRDFLLDCKALCIAIHTTSKSCILASAHLSLIVNWRLYKTANHDSFLLFEGKVVWNAQHFTMVHLWMTMHFPFISIYYIYKMRLFLTLFIFLSYVPLRGYNSGGDNSFPFPPGKKVSIMLRLHTWYGNQ